MGGVDRLTDTSKYTGSHKERFDESGKGKGFSGREDIKDNTGYVGAYKGAGTYDKTHWNLDTMMPDGDWLHIATSRCPATQNIDLTSGRTLFYACKHLESSASCKNSMQS